MGLSNDKYFDKVLGGWAGKSAGGILGAPIEGFKVFNELHVSDELFANNVPNDDLDLQILWLDLILQLKRQPQIEEMAMHWLQHVGFPWNEYGIATRNLQLGLLPPYSGQFNNKYWKESMGCPIRSELWGMMFPGDPKNAARFAKMDAVIDHAGFSVDAECFLAACAALSFEEKDPVSVMERGIEFVPEHCLIRQLYIEVVKWYRTYGFDVCRGKIKSRYGDADFTSAPMNIAFTILCLLDCNSSIEGITTGLHLGHDSDCIVASAGAIIGICLGYNAFPPTWKKRIGEKIVISEALTVETRPATLMDLSQLTVQAKELITRYSEGCKVVLSHEILDWKDTGFENAYKIRFELLQDYSNVVDVEVYLRSTCVKIEEHTWRMQLRNGIVWRNIIDVFPRLDGENRNYDFVAEVWVNGVLNQMIRVVLPYYGAWLALGPFIEHDKTLIGCDLNYPDHGVVPLPSVQYMNHDVAHSPKEWLSPSGIAEMVRDGVVEAQPFDHKLLHCSSFEVPILFAKGKGERTIYLYSKIDMDSDSEMWLSIGCTCKLTVWINNELLYADASRRRNWPGAHTILGKLRRGSNDIVVKLDLSLDDETFQIGFKHFEHKHPHQTFWSLITPFLSKK